MSKKPIIIGIESSCDETAVAIIRENDGRAEILSNVISSQVDVHKEFGVVPELAARSHIEKIDVIAKKALEKSGIQLKRLMQSCDRRPRINCVFVCRINFGKAISASIGKPFIAVNHLEGHALSPKLNSDIDYPFYCC